MYLLPGNMWFLTWIIYPPPVNVAPCNSLAQRASIRAVSCSLFYSKGISINPLALYSDFTNKLFPLKVPGAILWFWTGEPSSGFLISVNWAKTRNKEETSGGGKAAPNPQTTFHSWKNSHRASQAEYRVRISSPVTSVDRGTLEGDNWCNFHLLKHLKCIWSKEEKINHSAGSWQGDGQDDLICLSHY